MSQLDVGVVGDQEAQADGTFEPGQVPPHLGVGLEDALRQKLHELLFLTKGQLGSVYRAMVDLPNAGPTELRPKTTCANAGAVANRRAVVNAVINGIELNAPSVAGQAARSVRALIKNTDDHDVQDWLTVVRQRLEEKADSADAVIEEVKELEADSSELAASLESASGVYVYTYPHYWRHPFVPGTERRLLKVGRTSGTAWSRVLAQARRTGMPEDPLLLRVYRAESPVEVEKSFHQLLDAAEHERSVGVAVGVEWFSTTLEYCDTIATVLGLDVVKGSKAGVES